MSYGSARRLRVLAMFVVLWALWPVRAAGYGGTSQDTDRSARETRARLTEGFRQILAFFDRHDLSLGVPSFGSRWEGGPTTVSASLSILDPVTFDPAGNATDSLTPDVPAPADVEIGDRARLRIDGSVVLRVDVRCQEPWIVQELSVVLSQGGATGTDAGDFGIACTGRWRHVRLIVFPDSGTFVASAAQVDASFTVLDPDSFDPVDQAQASQEISVR